MIRAELDDSPPKLEKSEIKTATVHVYVKCSLLSSCDGHPIGGVLVQNRFIPDFGGTRRVCLDKARNVLEKIWLNVIDAVHADLLLTSLLSTTFLLFPRIAVISIWSVNVTESIT